MAAFTAPLETAFELQRTLLETGRETVETSLEFQTNANRALVDGIADQKDIQRRLLAIQHVLAHRLSDGVDEQVPGAHLATREFLDAVDDQFDRLYRNHEAMFANLLTELENGVEAYDEVGSEYLDALDGQLELIVSAQEELQTQSVEAAEQFDGEIESLPIEVVDCSEQADPIIL